MLGNHIFAEGKADKADGPQDQRQESMETLPGELNTTKQDSQQKGSRRGNQQKGSDEIDFPKFLAQLSLFPSKTQEKSNSED